MEITMRKKTSANSKILKALQSGNTLTARQMSTRYKLVNPYSAIYQLKGRGYKIKTTETGAYSL
jgi:hypothetical protein